MVELGKVRSSDNVVVEFPSQHPFPQGWLETRPGILADPRGVMAVEYGVVIADGEGFITGDVDPLDDYPEAKTHFWAELNYAAVAANLEKTSDGAATYNPATGKIDVAANTQEKDADAQRAQLLKDFASARYDKEYGGFTSVTGIEVRTDDRTRTILAYAKDSARADSDYTKRWKLADGMFTSLTAAQILAIADEMDTYIERCFQAEEAHGNAIAADLTPTPLTQAELFAYVAHETDFFGILP